MLKMNSSCPPVMSDVLNRHQPVYNVLIQVWKSFKWVRFSPSMPIYPNRESLRESSHTEQVNGPEVHQNTRDGQTWYHQQSGITVPSANQCIMFTQQQVTQLQEIVNKLLWEVDHSKEQNWGLTHKCEKQQQTKSAKDSQNKKFNQNRGLY